MASLLFSVITATALATAGMGAPGETRSAQSLPGDHLVVAATHPASSGNFHRVTRLADAGQDTSGSDSSNKDKCQGLGRHWNAKKMECMTMWPVPLIGAATMGGFIYAITSGDGSSGQSPVSN